MTVIRVVEVEVPGPQGPPGPSGSGGTAWEAVTIPTGEASWDTDTATGTWVFTTEGGVPVIKQTDDSQGNAGMKSIASFPGTDAWVIQFDLRIDSDHGDGGVNCGFGPGIDTGSPVTGQIITGPGLDNTPQIAGYVATQAFAPELGPTIAEGDWHTYRMQTVGLQTTLTLDGTDIAYGIGGAGSTSAGAKAPFVFYDIGGALTFRNLKAWRIPIPVLT